MKLKNLFFNLWYRFGKPPWIIDQAQPELIKAVKKREIRGSTVLDVGCGDGNNAIYLASKGFDVTGIDISANAIKMAKQNARKAKVNVKFMTLDALKIGTLDKKFDTIIDFGLFHNLKGESKRYVRALSEVSADKGQLLMLCFSDIAGEYEVYPHFYPKPMSQDEIHASFKDGWKIEWFRLGVVKAPKKYGNYSSWLTNMTSTK